MNEGYSTVEMLRATKRCANEEYLSDISTTDFKSSSSEEGQITDSCKRQNTKRAMRKLRRRREDENSYSKRRRKHETKKIVIRINTVSHEDKPYTISVAKKDLDAKKKECKKKNKRQRRKNCKMCSRDRRSKSKENRESTGTTQNCKINKSPINCSEENVKSLKSTADLELSSRPSSRHKRRTKCSCDRRFQSKVERESNSTSHSSKVDELHHSSEKELKIVESLVFQHSELSSTASSRPLCRPVPQCNRDCRYYQSSSIVSNLTSKVQHRERERNTKSKPTKKKSGYCGKLDNNVSSDTSSYYSDVETLISRAKHREKCQQVDRRKLSSATPPTLLQGSKRAPSVISLRTSPECSDVEFVPNTDHDEESKASAPKALPKISLVPLHKLLQPLTEANNEEPHNAEAKNEEEPGNMAKATEVNAIRPIVTVIPYCMSSPEGSSEFSCVNTAKQNTTAETMNQEITTQEINIDVGSMLNNKYDICEIIKRGSFSTIVRVIDKKENKKVVLKILHKNKCSYALQHLKILTTFDPVGAYHCVRLLGQFLVSGHLTLKLEDCACNLRQFLQQFGSDNGLCLTTVQIMGKQILTALQYLMEYSIVHTNIRPEHILVSSQNSLKLSGFDAAFSRRGKVESSRERGPLVYQSPEEILNIRLTHACDVWSAACVIYEMATGKTLFSGKTENEMIGQMGEVSGEFPNNGMRVGEHFQNGKFVRQSSDGTAQVNSDGRIPEARAPRDLAVELFRPYLASRGVPTIEIDSIVLVNLLSKGLRPMLVLEPGKRISADLALLDKFFHVVS